MLATQRGLTATYNRVHARAEVDSGVLALREMHCNLDLAVLAAYGWEDIDLDHDFRDTEEGLRFTISESARVELLDRLLELNHARHAEEIENGTAAPKKHAKTGRRARAAEELMPPLLEVF
jgi:hypothetical protein